MEHEEHNEAYYQLSKRRRVKRKVDLVLRTYSVMGLLISILSGGYFLITLLPIDLTMRQQTALMIAGAGVAIALMSRTLIVLRKEKESEEIERLKEFEALSNFLDTWTRFEQTSKEVLRKEGEDFNPHSLRSVISRLYEEGKIDKKDMYALDEALQTRNSIVHGERPLSSRIAENLTTSVLEIIKKIAINL